MNFMKSATVLLLASASLFAASTVSVKTGHSRDFGQDKTYNKSAEQKVSKNDTNNLSQSKDMSLSKSQQKANEDSLSKKRSHSEKKDKSLSVKINLVPYVFGALNREYRHLPVVRHGTYLTLPDVGISFGNKFYFDNLKKTRYDNCVASGDYVSSFDDGVDEKLKKIISELMQLADIEYEIIEKLRVDKDLDFYNLNAKIKALSKQARFHIEELQNEGAVEITGECAFIDANTFTCEDGTYILGIMGNPTLRVDKKDYFDSTHIKGVSIEFSLSIGDSLDKATDHIRSGKISKSESEDLKKSIASASTAGLTRDQSQARTRILSELNKEAVNLGSEDSIAPSLNPITLIK